MNISADHSLDDLKALLTEKGVAPMSINSIEFITFRGDEYPQIRARCRELCQLAQAIGCPTIVVVPSPTPSRETTWAEIVDEHVKVLRDLSDIAAEYGVKLSFELLGFGWCSVRTPRGAWEIVQKTGRDNVGLVIDCAHLYGGGGLFSEIDAVDPTHIFTFHLDDPEDMPKEAIHRCQTSFAGFGGYPLDDICRRLQSLVLTATVPLNCFARNTGNGIRGRWQSSHGKPPSGYSHPILRCSNLF